MLPLLGVQADGRLLVQASEEEQAEGYSAVDVSIAAELAIMNVGALCFLLLWVWGWAPLITNSHLHAVTGTIE